MSGYQKVCQRDDLEDGQVERIEMDGKDIALVKIDGEFHALDGTCPHQGGPLGEGMVDREELMCPWHGWTFEVESGEHVSLPDEGVETFDVKIDGDDVLVSV